MHATWADVPKRVRGRTVAVLGAALAATCVTAAPAAAQQQRALEIESVTAQDAKTIEIDFNEALSPELREFADGNASYLTHYIRVSGGSTGASDAALDGAPLDSVAGTAVRAVHTPRHDALRVILGSDATLTGAHYRLWFDGAGEQLAELYLEAANGDELQGTTSEKVGFTGSDDAASPAAIASVRGLDSRVVRITFGSSIVSGMPSGAYTGSEIEIAGSAGTLDATYVQPVAGTDDKVFDVSFGDDIDAGTSLRLEGLRLATSAGRLPADAVLESPVDAAALRHAAPAIDDASVTADGRQITVRFTGKLSSLAAGGETIPVAETPKGVGGTTLTADQVRGILNINGATVGDDGLRGEGHPGSAAADLRDVAAYLPDARTMVITLSDGRRLARHGAATVALRAAAVRDVTGTDNAGGSPVPVHPSHESPRTSHTEFDPDGRDFLRVDRHASVTFRHNAFEFNNPPVDYSIKAGSVKDRLVNQRVDAIKVENKYIEATFVPEYGGRLISLIYKPTGHDLLYTNPVGTPYGISNPAPGQPGTSPFYNNWLMVWGGIFPTVTEAEHGKYWFLPWDYSVSQRGDEVSLTMTKVDDFDYAQHPTKFRYGKTGIETKVVYTIDKDSPTVDMNVSLHNPSTDAKEYEYWTCTTLAPGADSHSGSPTMQIMAPVKVIQYDRAYSWMNQVDEPVHPGSDDRLLKLDKLKKMINWRRDGIAYGQDLATLPQNDWWGVVNHENEEGVVRVGENEITPGMKFWEWGFDNSFDTNVFSNGDSARPYIELWAGTSPRFFTPDVLQGGETKSWTETFMPTMGLADVTNANRNGSVRIAFSRDGGSTTVTGDVFSTRIGERLRAQLVDAASGKVLAHETFAGDASHALRLTGRATPGSTVRLVLTDRTGRDVLLTGEATDR